MKKLLAGICILTLAVLACNLVDKELTPSSPSRPAIATAVAQTMQAAEGASPTAPTVFDTPPLMTPSPSATPMAVVKAIAYCRSGPAETYKSVTNVNPNQIAAVLGKDSAGDYWLIEIASAECWVAAQDVAISGNTQNIPTVTPPPSTATGVPAAPSSLTYSYSCPSLTEATITLTWKDAANDESGYHVYRDENLIADLPANSTTYTDNTSRSPGSVFSYSVEAYNSVGASGQRTTGSFRVTGCANS